MTSITPTRRHGRQDGRRRRARLALAAAALLVIAAACGSDDEAIDATVAPGTEPSATAPPATEPPATEPPATEPPATEPPSTEPPAAEPQEITVKIDGRVDEFEGAFFAYFPDKVTVHPGDTIVYESVFSGEPHSVAFGSLVQNAIDEFRKLTPEQLESEGPPPPELEAAFAAIPPMLPEGPGDAIQSSVNPCFVEDGGTIPDDPAVQCPVTEPAPFTGTEAFYNSGFLPDGETFVLQLSEDIEPGVYEAFCTLHFTEMISEVTVVAPDEPIPAPEEVEEEGQAQLDALAAAAAPAIEEMQAAAPPGVIFAGAGSEEARQALVVEFLPENATAAVGEPVTWSIIGPHTVSFNPPESARTILVQGDDGGYHLVEEALAPAGFEPPPPPEGEGEGDEATGGEEAGGEEGGGEEGGEGEGGGGEGPPPPLDAGTWDGTGFFSSGFLFGGDFVLRFSTPGTYDYVCLVHPEMQGTISIE